MNNLGQFALRFTVSVATAVAVHYTSKAIVNSIDNASKKKSTSNTTTAKSGRG